MTRPAPAGDTATRFGRAIRNTATVPISIPFLSRWRGPKIPARFQIGFPVPPDKSSAEIPGYHCWAEFYIDSDRMGSGRYFRGVETSGKARLLLWRTRRKSRAVHARTGPEVDAGARWADRLNYFVYPYVEVGGQGTSERIDCVFLCRMSKGASTVAGCTVCYRMSERGFATLNRQIDGC